MKEAKKQDRIAALEQQHKTLDNQIKVAYNNYKSNAEVEVMKKQKLRIKDELEQLKQ